MFKRDQADGLRALFDRQRPNVLIMAGGTRAQPQVCAAVARAYAAQDIPVLLLDGSTALLAPTLGVTVRYELAHVIAGDKRLAEVVHFPEANIALLPARRGLEQLAHLDARRGRTVREQFATWRWPVELLIVNARAQTSALALATFGGNARVIAVVSGEGDTITAAYREIKGLRQVAGVTECDVIVHGAHDHEAARAVFSRLALACEDFLGVRCSLRESAGRRHLDGAREQADDAAWLEWKRHARGKISGIVEEESVYAAIG
jgi:flagellar biosynthesis protein FlhG